MSQTTVSTVEHLHNIVLGEKCFVNEKFLVKPGMVYVPKLLGQEVVMRLRGGKLLAVFNALNGMFPVLLQKAYPKAKIVCIEHFPFFVKHLTNMGFETYLYSDNKWKTMHFDAAVLNPPYNGNLDLEFIKSACSISDRVIAVHPSMSIISRRKTKKYVEFKKRIDGHVSYIKLFNGNPVFGIGLFYPCEIIDIDMTQTFSTVKVEYAFDSVTSSHTFKSLFDITKWGNIPEYYTLEKRILNYCESSNCHENWDDSKGKWFVNLAKIRGHVSTAEMFLNDFYTFVPQGLAPEKEPRKFIQIGFATQNEATNFIDYLKSDFARFCLSIYKNNADQESGELSGVPYLPSYDKPWTKDRLTKLFNITDKEWAFIEKVIPKYYD